MHDEPIWVCGFGHNRICAVMETVQGYVVLNEVARDKLAQILTRVLEKLAANESEVFTMDEKDQLKTRLGLDEAQIDATVANAKEVFTDAATFGHVDRNLLTSRGVEEKVVHIVEKTWRKKGRSMEQQIATHHAVETPHLVLQKTDWRLHLQMGSDKLSGQSQPTAIFQLDVADKSSPTNETERLDVELSHAELRRMFLQLNAIQAELDAPPPSSAA